MFELPSNVYQILDLTSGNTKIEKIDKNRLPYLNSSPLTQPSSSFPVYYQTDNSLVVSPQTVSNLLLQYIKMPVDPRFGYTTEQNYGTQVYDANPFVAGGITIGTKSINIVSTNRTDITTSQQYNLTVGSGGVTATGSGTGASFTVTVSGNTITAIEFTSAGSGFAIGDTIIISNTAIPNSGSGNMVLTLRAQDLYSSTTEGSTDFIIHKSQETELIISILAYAGFVVNKPQVTQAAVQMGQGNQIAKQNQ